MSQCLLADGFPRTIQDGNPQRWSESSPLLRTFFLVERRKSDGEISRGCYKVSSENSELMVVPQLTEELL